MKIKALPLKLFSMAIIVAMLSFNAVAAIAAPPVQAEQDIFAIAQNDERLSTFTAAVQQAELNDTLSGEGPYTVFAPTDEAFDALPDGMLTDLLTDKQALQDVLRYHVADGLIVANAANRMGEVPTMQGATANITFDESTGTLMIGDATIIEENIEASNGIIHLIDKVLLPPATTDEATTPASSDVLLATCAEEYVVQADDWLSKLADRFYQDPLGYGVIFDATNAAAQQDESYPTILDPDIIEVGQKLCIPSARDAQAIMSGTVDSMSNEGVVAGEEAMSEPMSEAVDETMAETMMDETAAMTETAAMEDMPDDGMMNQTIVDLATQDGRFDTLVQALTAANLDETLQQEGPYTVFAPTDEAFDALPEGMLDNLLADPQALQTVLLYHVVDGRVPASDVMSMESATTLQGANANISVDGETVMIDDATVIEPNLEASNGIIHVIDTVLMPPQMEESQ